MRIPSKPAVSSNQWMLSFADLLSLILTFFVLIYSMANPIQQTNIFKNNFDSLKHQESDINFADIKVERFATEISSEYLDNIFETTQNPALKNLRTSSKANKFIISIPLNKIDDKMIQQIAETIRVFDKRKHIYSNNLDFSKKIADQLRTNGVNSGLGFYEDRLIEDRIDIVIKL